MLLLHFAAPIRPSSSRVEEGRVLLDLRTVVPGQDEIVESVLRRLSGE